MEKIYKYTSLANAIKIIKNNSVVVNCPNSFNDPFDSMIDFDKKDIDKTISVVNEFYVVQEFLKMMNNEKIKYGFLTKIMVSWNNFIINIRLNYSKKDKYYKSICFFRGLSKLMIKCMLKKDKDEYYKKREEFKNSTLQEVKEMRKKVLISCFGKKYDSILMWAHYGDKHRGVCIEFDRPINDFFDVKYSKERCKFPLEQIVRRLLGYSLSNENADTNDPNLIKCISLPFLTKSIDWKYEEEVRCVFSENDNNIIEEDDKKLFKMPTKITKIFIGCNVDKSSKEYKELVKISKDIKIYHLSASENQFELCINNSFEECNEQN